LDPAPYIRAARTFATVTPIVLDRHLKHQGAAREEEIVSQLTAACQRIGLPAPRQVVAAKHSALEGAPSAWPSGHGPAWLSWRLPPSLAGRQLTHAVLTFAEPVEGPVLLGAGRFHGLGLCLPLEAEVA
jgi:CRISPR-associated protein Csb2